MGISVLIRAYTIMCYCLFVLHEWDVLGILVICIHEPSCRFVSDTE